MVKEKLRKWLGVDESVNIRLMVAMQNKIKQLADEVASTDSVLLMLRGDINRMSRGKALDALQKAAMDYAKDQLTGEDK